MKKDRFICISLGIIVLVLAGVVFKLAKTVLFPFILAVFLSYLMDPVLELLSRTRVPHWLAVTAVLASAFAFIYLLGVAGYEGGKTLAETLPQYEPRAAELAGKISALVHSVLPSAGQVGMSFDLQAAAGWLGRGLESFVGMATGFFLVLVFTTLIMLGRGRALEKIRSVLPSQAAAGAVRAVTEINGQVRKYLVIKTIMGLINGVVVWAVLAAFKVDFALLFGILSFVLNYIPSIGSVLAAVLRVGFAYFQFGNFWVPFWVLVLTVGADTMMGNFVEPRIMGSGLGLSPLVIIFSLVFWGWLWGIAGMIIAVPLTALIKIICRNVPGLGPVAVLME